VASVDAQPMPATGQRASEPSLMLAALGVVYGDIGTSPLYAVRQSLLAFGDSGPPAVLGILSLIAWSLILVVTVKYVLVIMRADNRGEGGLLALTALALRTSRPGARAYVWIMGAGVIGAALFYGDAILTPAISVLSAVEGLKVATPLFEPYVIPIALVLLVGLFAVQRRGTAAIGGLFGPVMLLWFAVLALLGVGNIAQRPEILLALNPLYGLELLLSAPLKGFIMLGAVFLAVTGAEALYADMGHFGRQPMRRAWLYLVFPALLLNYFGQGALLLGNPAALEHPFYRLVPEWGLYPLVALASAATIIASQAVISGAFSITRQAVQLGYLPRLRVLHTSESEIGQVYAPKVNTALLVAVIALILGFQSSDNLGAAYGIAITGMMVITSALAFVYMRSIGWRLAVALPVFGGFLALDLVFFSANLVKIAEGGWFPVLVAVVVFAVMATWWRGRQLLAERLAHDNLPLEAFLAGLRPDRPARVPGTAIFMARNIDYVPVALLHAIKHFKVLHERSVLMTVETADVPHVPEAERLELRELGKGFYAMRLRYGFMDEPNIVHALEQAGTRFPFKLLETSFVIGRQKLIAGRRLAGLPAWRKQLFILMANNALDATEFFRIPPNRAVELGGQVEI
jgi:KUP system potassium uptake protein